jgi:uncharacterized protein (TIGR02246 family)
MASDPAVTACIDALFEAWNSKDPATFAAVFATDAEFTDVIGNHVTGRQGIAELHVFPFTKMFQAATLTRTDIQARALTADWVTIDAAWSLTGHTTPLGDERPDWAGSMHVIARGDGTGWSPTVVHNVLIRSGGAPLAM